MSYGLNLGLGEPIEDVWGFPKIRGTFMGVPIIRTTVYWGLYWGPLILGNYHIGGYRGTYSRDILQL